MITELIIRDPRNTPISHWTTVPFLRKASSIRFEPGLNIVYGANGTGKSTLIKALATLTHTLDTGWPVVTKASVMRFSSPRGPLDGLLLVHDGSPARYLSVDPSDQPPPNSSVENVSALRLDDGTMSRPTYAMSHGQASLTHLYRFLRSSPVSVTYRLARRHTSGDFTDLYDVAVESLRNKVKGLPKKPVILLDEVDRSLDFARQAAVWKQIRALAKDYQVIVASHSPFAVYAPDANYIETDVGYLHKSQAALSRLPEMMKAQN